MPARSLTTSRTGTGVAPGTCGELAQGVLPGGARFHVTCPIDLTSQVEVTIHPATAFGVHGLAPGATKTYQSLALAAQLLELGPVRVDVTHASGLTVGKGMASSTADIVAAARALAAACGETLDGPTLAGLATTIEPSDGVMYDGVVALDHHTGQLLRTWSWGPRLTIAMFTPTRSRLTTRTGLARQDHLAHAYASLLHDVDAAMSSRDLAALGEAATRSAELNQAFAPNPMVPILRDAMRRTRALGLCVGHSGTLCGLLFPPGEPGGAAAQAAIALLHPLLPPGTEARVVSTAT